MSDIDSASVKKALAKIRESNPNAGLFEWAGGCVVFEDYPKWSVVIRNTFSPEKSFFDNNPGAVAIGRTFTAAFEALERNDKQKGASR